MILKARVVTPDGLFRHRVPLSNGNCNSTAIKYVYNESADFIVSDAVDSNGPSNLTEISRSRILVAEFKPAVNDKKMMPVTPQNYIPLFI